MKFRYYANLAYVPSSWSKLSTSDDESLSLGFDDESSTSISDDENSPSILAN
jgi:hypothetical protein